MAQKTLLADGNRRKPPLSNLQQNSLQSDKDSIITEQSSGTRPLSTATLDGLSILDGIEDIDDDITTSASDSYAHEDSTSNEGKISSNLYVDLMITRIYVKQFLLS